MRSASNDDRHPEVLAKRASKDDRRDEVARGLGPSPFEARPAAERLRVTENLGCAWRPLIMRRRDFIAAKFGNLFLREGDAFRAVAVHGPPTSNVACIDGNL